MSYASPDPQGWLNNSESEATSGSWNEPVGKDDSAGGRVRFGWPGAAEVCAARIKRTIGWELLIVLVLFPLGSAILAVADLAQRIHQGYPVVSHSFPAQFTSSWQEILILALAQLPLLGVAALVIYLLTRSGEGVRAINLGTTRLRTDLALLLPVFVVGFWLPQWFGREILSWSHTTGYFLTTPYRSQSTITVSQVLLGITAGIVEEIVVLGYLVRRLEQRGYAVWLVIAIDVLVRVSYHLYYGWNVVPILLWALVSVLIYLRIRRLLPFILCHIAYDVSLSFRAFYRPTYTVTWILALAATTLFAVLWWGWRPTLRGASLDPVHPVRGSTEATAIVEQGGVQDDAGTGVGAGAGAGGDELDGPTKWYARAWIPLTLLILLIGGFVWVAVVFHPRTTGYAAAPTTLPPRDPAIAAWISRHQLVWNQTVEFSFDHAPGSQDLVQMLMIGSNFQCVGSNCPPGGYPSPRQQIAQDCAQLRSDVLRLPRVARLPNATASLQLASGFAHVLAGVSTCHAWLAEKTRPLLVRAQTEVGRGLNEISSAVQIIHNLGGA